MFRAGKVPADAQRAKRRIDRASIEQGPIGSDQDFTAPRTGARAALRLGPGTAQRPMAAAVAASNDAIISIGTDLAIHTWNAGAQRMFGYAEAEALGHRLSELIVPDVELIPCMRGWRGYFGFCETPQVLVGLTRWVRLRLRAALWRQWKTPRRRRAALVANGVSESAARKTAGSGLGPWYLARSKALSTGLSNPYFKALGLPSLFQSC